MSAEKYVHAHYSRRCDTALIPISAGAGVPRDYDAPIYSHFPRLPSDYSQATNYSQYHRESADDLPCDVIEDEIEDDGDVKESEYPHTGGIDRSWSAQRHQHVSAFTWYHSYSRDRRGNFLKSKVMPNPSTYIEDPFYSGCGYDPGYGGGRDAMDRDEARESDDEARYSDSGQEESESSEEEEWEDDEAAYSDEEEDEDESETEDQVAPGIASYGEDIESIYTPRLLLYTELPNSLCEVIGSYMDPDADLGLLLDDVCTMALRCIDQIGQYRMEAKKFDEYLPEPKAKVLAEELPPNAAEVLKKILEKKNVGTVPAVASSSSEPAKNRKKKQPDDDDLDDSDYDEDYSWENRDVVPRGTLFEYPARMYLCSRSRRALRELEKMIEYELDGSVHTLTQMIMKRVQNRSLPPLSRLRLDMMMRLLTHELDAWDQLMSEMESRLDTADEEWRFASNLLMVSDYILTSRSVSSQIRPKRPFRVILTGRGDARKYELKPATKKDDEKLVELLSFPDSGSQSTAAVSVDKIPATSMKPSLPSSSSTSALVIPADEEKKESDTVTVDADSEMKVDDGGDADGADSDGEGDDNLIVPFSAYTISPISGASQEASEFLGSTLADAIQRLEAELSLVDIESVEEVTKTAPSVTTALASSSSSSLSDISLTSSDPLESLANSANTVESEPKSGDNKSGSSGPTSTKDPRVALLEDLDAIYPRTVDREVSKMVQDLMNESITSKSYGRVIKANDGVLDPKKHVQCLLPADGSETSKVDIDQVDRNLLALSILNRRQLVDFGEHTRMKEPLSHVDLIEMNRAEFILERAWKFIHRCFPAATKDEVTGGISMNDESDDDDGVQKPLPTIVTLMHKLRAVIREPTYSYHMKPQQQHVKAAATASFISSSTNSMSDALQSTSALTIDDRACGQPLKKQKANDGAALDASPAIVTDAVVAGPSCLQTGEYTIFRRVMTPQKHAAAVILTSQLDRLRLFMSRHTQDYCHDAHLGQLRRLIESARIAMSHYYLLHMTRSESLDNEIAALNAHFSSREESHHVDHVFNRSVFMKLVREIGQDFRNGLLFTNLAVQILQEACEQEIVHHFALAAPTLKPPPPALAIDVTSFYASKMKQEEPDTSLQTVRELSIFDLQRSSRNLPLKRRGV